MVNSVYRDVTINDLISCGSVEIISACEPDVEEYLQDLSRSTKNAREHGDISKSNALEFIDAPV